MLVPKSLKKERNKEDRNDAKQFSNECTWRVNTLAATQNEWYITQDTRIWCIVCIKNQFTLCVGFFPSSIKWKSLCGVRREQNRHSFSCILKWSFFAWFLLAIAREKKKTFYREFMWRCVNIVFFFKCFFTFHVKFSLEIVKTVQVI